MAEQELAYQHQQVQTNEEELVSLLKSTTQEQSYCFSPKKQGEKAKEQGSPYKKIFLHILSSCCVIAFLAASFNYLAFKALLYARNAREVVTTAPWLLIVFMCECAYFMGNVMAAIADHLLPPGIRQDLTFLENDKIDSIMCHAKIDGLPANDSLNLLNSTKVSSKDGCLRVDILMKEFSAECYPRVDILLPCCKEPSDIPQDSVKAALALDYPQDRFKVLVLDDGGDDDLKAFCEALQMETGSERLQYFRREKVSITHTLAEEMGSPLHHFFHYEREFMFR